MSTFEIKFVTCFHNNWVFCKCFHLPSISFEFFNLDPKNYLPSWDLQTKLQVILWKKEIVFHRFHFRAFFHNFSLIKRAEEERTRQERKFDFSSVFCLVATELPWCFPAICKQIGKVCANVKAAKFAVKVSYEKDFFICKEVNLMPTILHISRKAAIKILHNKVTTLPTFPLICSQQSLRYYLELMHKT